MTNRLMSAAVAVLLAGAYCPAQAQQITLGHLADYSGATSDVGTPFGQGIADTFAWINKNGGINGKPVTVDTVEAGDMTKDLALLVGADQKWLSTTGFLDKVDENLKNAMTA